MTKHEDGEKAMINNVPCNCMWCDKDCDNTEIIDTGEAWERWCYCPDCDDETYHLIENHDEVHKM